ncbi:MAG: FtsQ-type POTRA domain-containing protein [Desulfobacterales bacterium]|nr:FtsQ-type POTRA domain-containing protein [Desulfobacterales bacterium]
MPGRSPKKIFSLLHVVHWISATIVKGSLLIAIVAMISLTFLSLYRYLINSPYLKLQQIDVEGVEQEIRHELIRLSGLDLDMSMLSIDLKKLKQKMEEHPWVRSVGLERRFPNTLIVYAENEIPCAIVVMDKLYCMNRWGEIFREVYDSDKMDLPIVTGISKQVPVKRKQLKRAARIIRVLESEEKLLSLSQLSEVNLKKDDGLSLYFSQWSAEVKIMCELPAGTDSQQAEAQLMCLLNKMHGLRKVAEHLKQTGQIHDATIIDLDYADGAVVSFRKG